LDGESIGRVLIVMIVVMIMVMVMEEIEESEIMME
jgi:hypothetical protein